MYFCHYKDWLLSMVAVVALAAGSAVFYSLQNANDSEMVRFIDLSDADIDMIMAVKAEMQLAKIEAN